MSFCEHDHITRQTLKQKEMVNFSPQLGIFLRLWGLVWIWGGFKAVRSATGVSCSWVSVAQVMGTCYTSPLGPKRKGFGFLGSSTVWLSEADAAYNCRSQLERCFGWQWYKSNLFLSLKMFFTSDLIILIWFVSFIFSFIYVFSLTQELIT